MSTLYYYCTTYYYYYYITYLFFFMKTWWNFPIARYRRKKNFIQMTGYYFFWFPKSEQHDLKNYMPTPSIIVTLLSFGFCYCSYFVLINLRSSKCVTIRKYYTITLPLWLISNLLLSSAIANPIIIIIYYRQTCVAMETQRLQLCSWSRYH